MYKKIVYCAVLALVCFGCSYPPRASYSTRTLYVDARSASRNFGNSSIAVLPLLSAGGAVAFEESGEMADIVRHRRPDLKFASGGDFENGFPLRFDKREIAAFYKALFSEEILAAKNMDDIWKHAEQPYFLVFSLAEGASTLNRGDSVVKQVNLRGELWSRDDREVIWRAECKGVSDDGSVDDRNLITESVRLLADELPQAQPNYGRESW